MKKLLPLLVLLVISISIQAQNKFGAERLAVSVEKENYNNIIDGQEFVRKFAKQNGIDLDKLAKEETPVQKTSAWNFVVGSKYNWWSLDRRTGAPSSFYQAASTCRAVGTNCYIFVEDSLWNAGGVDQVGVDNIKTAFDSSTPANPFKGIYQTNVDAFGNPPNVDGDPKIIIFILRIRDDVGTDGGFTAGYFYSGNQSTTAANSNKAEMYYMEGQKVNLKSGSGVSLANSIMAHEFQHMIQWNYKRTNPHSTFFNEGCSMIAEVLNGYPIRLQSQYNGDAGRYLLNWSDASSLADYGRAARFMLYIKEQFGPEAFAKFVQSNVTDVNAWDLSVFPSYGTRRFADVLEDWLTANAVMDKTVDPKWGYDYNGLSRATPTPVGNPNVTNSSSGVFKLSAKYLSFTNGKNLTINFNVNYLNSIKIKAVKTTSAGKVVENVTPLVNYSVPDFGSGVSEVLFVVLQNDQGEFIASPSANSFPFTFTSSATVEAKIVEMKYDNREPAGIYGWAVGDSVAVGFDGYAGMRLDSVKAAIRTLAPISGGVWRQSAVTTSLLGKPLAVPITVSGNVYNGVPYPIPWNNWGKADVRSYNIDAGIPYIVSFVIDGAWVGGSSTGPNRVMHTYESESNSLTYTTNAGNRRWFNFYVDQNTQQDSFIVYLIRAYISNGTSDVSEPIEVLPVTYTLDQNYPNPFNPNTVISFQIPKQSNVEIKIYDALGSEIKTLIRENRNAGKYNIMWNGDDKYGRKVASGIYYYKITADNFSQTKKMILMK